MDGKFIISSKLFPKLTSNHHLISMLFEKEEDLGPILFLFSPFSIERADFSEIVSKSGLSTLKDPPASFGNRNLRKLNML